MRSVVFAILALLCLAAFSGCKSYYYQETEGKCFYHSELEKPVYLGEIKTIEQAIENTEEALKHYFGDNVKIGKHRSFGLNYFADENMWLIITEYDPDRLGGGISFTIDGETGELSEYQLNE